uniref:Uncharacterized protein n=1 Tax=Panagrolaimus sp. ES5 TaxID=591445 RepID=A0AC34F4I6_9BILA
MKTECLLLLGILLIGLVLNGEAAPYKPGNPFGDRSEENSESAEYIDEKKPAQRGSATSPKSSSKNSDETEYYEDDEEGPSTRAPIIIPRTTPSPIRENIMYTILPTLQKKTIKYCAYNQYTFMTTCRPGKKLRYDLQVFCQEYADYCGVPNIHLYPSRTPQAEYRPGYGQKQQNGQLGMGRSFGFGLGAIPGFEIVGSRGADIGTPGLQVGGLMFNSGTDIGILGERIGKGPARAIGALEGGYPSFGLDPNTKSADNRASNAALRSLGIPPVPGLAKKYADYCGVPNIHLYPSRTPQAEYRPAGYGQKQQNGQLGMGRSFGFGLGAIPGFEIVGSRGADIGTPGLQVGGLMFNSGTDIGILGERIGKGPARAIGALEGGYPSFGLDPNTKSADNRASNAALRSLGIPPVPGLAKIFGNLQAPGLKKKKGKILFEPGYDAVDRNAPIATGRTDGESVNLPATFGKIEILEGTGMGVGKK